MLEDFHTRHLAALAWSGTALTVAVALTIALRFAPIAPGPVIALFILLLAIAGLVALGIDVRAAIRDADSASAALARAAGSFAILATGAILFLPCMLVTSIAVIWATLAVNGSTYALIVNEAQAGVVTPDTDYQAAHGIRFRLVSNQPVQIVFPINGGREEGWGAIVYDATSASDTAIGRKGGNAVPDSVQATFGQARCSAMITRYYRCA